MDKSIFRKRIKQLLAAGLTLVGILVAWLIYSNLTFHVVSTDPSTGDVATVSPYFKINFNKALSANGLSVSENPSLGTYEVSGKTLTINITSLLNQNTTYKITVEAIRDVKGSQLKNIVFQFTPKFISPSDLEKSQQNAILKRQAQAATNQPPSFSGTNALISVGLSTSQVEDFEQGTINYAKSNNIKLSSVIVDQSSVSSGPITGDGVFTVSFNFSAGGNQYSATLTYSGLESAQLNIYNLQGASLYQYGNSGSASDTGSASSTT